MKKSLTCIHTHKIGTFQVVSALQGITDGEQGCAIEDFSPEVTNSTCSVSDISCSQGKKEKLIQVSLGIKMNQESKKYTVCCGSNKKILGLDSLRTKEYQSSLKQMTYSGP